MKGDMVTPVGEQDRAADTRIRRHPDPDVWGPRPLIRSRSAAFPAAVVLLTRVIGSSEKEGRNRCWRHGSQDVVG